MRRPSARHRAAGALLLALACAASALAAPAAPPCGSAAAPSARHGRLLLGGAVDDAAAAAAHLNEDAAATSTTSMDAADSQAAPPVGLPTASDVPPAVELPAGLLESAGLVLESGQQPESFADLFAKVQSRGLGGGAGRLAPGTDSSLPAIPESGLAEAGDAQETSQLPAPATLLPESAPAGEQPPAAAQALTPAPAPAAAPEQEVAMLPSGGAGGAAESKPSSKAPVDDSLLVELIPSGSAPASSTPLPAAGTGGASLVPSGARVSTDTHAALLAARERAAVIARLESGQAGGGGGSSKPGKLGWQAITGITVGAFLAVLLGTGVLLALRARRLRAADDAAYSSATRAKAAAADDVETAGRPLTSGGSPPESPAGPAQPSLHTQRD